MNVLSTRHRLGLNCKQFARLVGCSVATLNSWERHGIEPDGALRTIVEAIETASNHEIAKGFLVACARDGRGLADVLQELFAFWRDDRSTTEVA